MPTQAPITETGCYLDNHRGHYLARDVIQLAQGFGFIIDPFAQWAIDGYEDHSHEEDYPAESLIELSEEAIEWLNSGQDDCADCGGSGIDPGSGEYFTRADDPDQVKRCKACSGSGQAPRVPGQNFPPRVPAGHYWDWNDGDFGLYAMDTSEDPCTDHGFDVCPDCGNAGTKIGADGYEPCTRFLTCWSDPS